MTNKTIKLKNKDQKTFFIGMEEASYRGTQRALNEKRLEKTISSPMIDNKPKHYLTIENAKRLIKENSNKDFFIKILITVILILLASMGIISSQDAGYINTILP